MKRLLAPKASSTYGTQASINPVMKSVILTGIANITAWPYAHCSSCKMREQSIAMTALLFLALLGAAAALPERSRANSTASDDAAPFFGTVHMFERANFKGYWVLMSIKLPDACYDVDCFDNKASSAAWDLPADGNFGDYAYLAMFTDKNCKGMMHVWNLCTDKNDTNLAEKARMNDQVSSIMVMKTSMTPISYVKSCSGDTFVFNSSSQIIHK